MDTEHALDGIDTTVPPSGTGCADCDAAEPQGWWVHLRLCAQCGHVGCCDTSPAQHATAHAEASGHQVIRSFEPDEAWFYSFAADAGFEGPFLAPPDAHPADQPIPGPAGRVPPDWEDRLN